MCPAEAFALYTFHTSAPSPGCSFKTKENVIFQFLGLGYKIHIGCLRSKTTFGNFKTHGGYCSPVSCLSPVPCPSSVPCLPHALPLPCAASPRVLPPMPCPSPILPLPCVLLSHAGLGLLSILTQESFLEEDTGVLSGDGCVVYSSLLSLGVWLTCLGSVWEDRAGALGLPGSHVHIEVLRI